MTIGITKPVSYTARVMNWGVNTVFGTEPGFDVRSEWSMFIATEEGMVVNPRYLDQREVACRFCGHGVISTKCDNCGAPKGEKP